MNLKEIGEFGLIDIIKQDTIVDESSVLVGIGDDAAVLIPTEGLLQLVSADMLVESIHFDLTFISAWQLGYKAIAVNLSDIAAMGGRPKQAVVSIAIPENISANFVVELYNGMKSIARQFNVNIVGGDTVASPKGLVINVTVLGEVADAFLQKRSTAKVGDLVVVSGYLGSSSAGLDLLQAGEWRNLAFSEPLVLAHLMPRPQVTEAGVIAKYANSMNDISDGLASEAKEIAKASRVGLKIYEDKIPLQDELIEASKHFDKAAINYALYGGEDYQLVFTIEPEKYEFLKKYKVAETLTVIGEVTRNVESVELVQTDGKIVCIEPTGYNHFK